MSEAFILPPRAAALLAFLVAGCGGGGGGNGWPVLPPAPAPAPAPATSLKLEGSIDLPRSYTAADLAARAPVTQTVTYTSGSGSGSQTKIYTGANLWSLLADAGIQLDASRKNDVLGRYVVATGADGYRSIFSLGEIHPEFGNRASIVAYAAVTGGSSAPLDEVDGPFRVTAPTDIKGGRYVSSLVKLQVQPSAALTAGVGGGTSASFRVSGQVATAATYDIAALKGLPAVTQTVAGTAYTGVSLWTLLNTIGLKPPAGKNPTLAMYAVATGSDGYRALVSLGEIDPGFGNNGAMVAYEINGAGLGANGMARLVIPGEVKQGRLVSNLIAIEVLAATGP
ncbi:molybdopterin-binding oxidoreductase [Variovorax sp. KK3]|uniref:molybdopterin-binding oxidoreductase n=1 Tax=Variovorax sp. KK3 TaxID=1855728 RepID=UPI00097C1DF8|nr:molybdopterin-binding oxidoreductase [Variovorax sp. KK3]